MPFRGRAQSLEGTQWPSCSLLPHVLVDQLLTYKVNLICFKLCTSLLEHKVTLVFSPDSPHTGVSGHNTLARKASLSTAVHVDPGGAHGLGETHVGPGCALPVGAALLDPDDV